MFFGLRTSISSRLVPNLSKDAHPDLRKGCGGSAHIMSSTSDFGTNDWLFDEMRERFLDDPSSVPAQWHHFFTKESSGAIPATPIGVPATVESREQTVETPNQPGQSSSLGPEVPRPARREHATKETPNRLMLRGVGLKTAQNMDASLSIPTATSVRTVPMKLAIENRATINNFLRRSRGGKVSFTHIVAYAMVQAIKQVPVMNHSYSPEGDRPAISQNPHINLGVAIDLTKRDQRQLLVPNIKACEELDFAAFYAAYEDLVSRARDGKLVADDFAGTTVTITNPGGIGTNLSVPRLMPGQGVILGVGSIDYGAAFEGTNQLHLTDSAISKVSTLTSTYDHRVIQGAQSGEFLRHMHHLLMDADGFYEQIFEAMRIPYPPFAWSSDQTFHADHQLGKAARVAQLINSYRLLGHLQADIDPIEFRMRAHPDLRLSAHGLSIWDLDRRFPVDNFAGYAEGVLSLREIVDILRDSYAHTMGIEYMHIHDPNQRQWFIDRLERPHQSLPHEEHLRILDELCEAEVFETFLQTKYVGQTRFSLEGAESAMVILAEICEQAANGTIQEVCIGMPHRGRLNVLANIVGKAYSQIFKEFDNLLDNPEVISGDVKYHLGAEGRYVAASSKSVLTSVAANPSHLEAVDPVLQGIARAKSDRLPHPETHRVLPVLMHGDASFSGQGIVYETLQMSQLRPYRNGGTIHLVVNNQVGFTTGVQDARTSAYATDVAKAVQIPIIHVNGDDPDSCALAAQMAFDYRETFGKDVVIDMLCYRRRGHNEGDDPSLTQPQMYDLIDKKRPVRRLYTQQLIGRGDITPDDAEQAVQRFRERLEEVFSSTKATPRDAPDRLVPEYPRKGTMRIGTSVSPEAIAKVAAVYGNFPPAFNVHPKVDTIIKRRVDALLHGPIDWATAETLAFGTLLLEGHQVRLAGQDSRRGTFSQRFGAIVDRQTNEAWVPLKHLSSTQGAFDIYDSNLSEYAAMGFEYGYSVASPNSLVCWEAQYGDFANGAQIIIDEFVASGYAKWTQKSGVVLLLPHGYEGTGPDHSSARIERFLNMCAEENMAVCQPSTPASYFHLLRQHTQVNWHRPVVIATPKSMLRNKQAFSPVDDFVHGSWRPVLGDTMVSGPSRVRSILLCSGKVRWELTNQRETRSLNDQVAIITLERLYPYPVTELAAELLGYPPQAELVWVQEEPDNQGPWNYIRNALIPQLEKLIHRKISLRSVTRPAAAAPSTGSMATHRDEHRILMDRVFASDLTM